MFFHKARRFCDWIRIHFMKNICMTAWLIQINKTFSGKEWTTETEWKPGKHGFAENLSYIRDNNIAVVVCTHTLSCVLNVDKCLNEIYRVLKPVSRFSKSKKIDYFWWKVWTVHFQVSGELGQQMEIVFPRRFGSYIFFYFSHAFKFKTWVIFEQDQLQNNWAKYFRNRRYFQFIQLNAFVWNCNQEHWIVRLIVYFRFHSNNTK